MTSPIACENSKPGSPESEWDISGAGDPNLQGFSTDISYAPGETAAFKIKSTTGSYRLDIYRIGYYGGLGARKIGTVTPLNAFSAQPSCLNDAATGLVDCGNWSVSANWTIPASAVSGVYVAKLVRTDGQSGSSHIVFVVRDDSRRSAVLFQTSDSTWQAYNRYGGNSLYVGEPVGRAYKVSYNRPLTTRGDVTHTAFFDGEYPMIRWLERNGYDVSYTTDIDSDRRGAELLEHKVFLSVGHDEYWSAAQRANVEAARAAGVHLGFFSGNEVFWKTRLEPSVDGSATPNRTLVSYKETHAGAKIDPNAAWTGTWRDPRFSPLADGGRPENALTGQLFMVNFTPSVSIDVPAADGKMRFWRSTSVATQAAGATARVGSQVLGYEWDADVDNGSRPAGAFRLSSTTVSGVPVLQDHGSNYATDTATHNMTLYRAASGALVFGAGTTRWAWGLDDVHDSEPAPTDQRMQQATVNLLADMGTQPASLQAGLSAATQSTDTAKPTSTITAPAAGAQLESGAVTITGTATDTGGQVGGVEVSTDGGTTWRRANGRGTWSYTWQAKAGSHTLRSRAVDDSGNLETPSAGRSVTVTQPCCSIWPDSATPAVTSAADTGAVELGVKFRADVAGQITGLRFYRGPANNGPHVGHLWTASGTLLAEATFSSESAEGWQKVNLSTPVSVNPDTTYVASYHAPRGRYSVNAGMFNGEGVTNEPLRALADNEDGANGVFKYGPSGSFPTSTFNAANYWVDVVFKPTADATPPTVQSVSPAAGRTGVSVGSDVEAVFSERMTPGSLTTSTFKLRDPGGAEVPATVTYNQTSRTATLDSNGALAANTRYTASIQGGSAGARDLAGNPLAQDHAWSFTTGEPSASGCPCTLWPSSTTPSIASHSDTGAVEIGVKFRSSTAGRITAIRYYKGATNPGPHVGHLWTAGGLLLATVPFTGETSQGWQQASLTTPVTISANTTYVVSYHNPSGRYAADGGYFASSGVERGPLRAPQNGELGGNGVYTYGPSGSFPSSTFNSTNYWADVVFDDTPPPAPKPPTASFTVSPNPAPTGTTVNFNAAGSSDPDGTIAKYEWDLDGNGTYETDTGTGATATRSYAKSGNLAVGLRVTDNDGSSETTTRALSITNRAPSASFTASPSPAQTRQTVTFNAGGSGDPDGTIARYEWDLDGNGVYETDTGTAATTTRVYATPGTFTLRLRVTDDEGAQTTATRSLTVASAYRASVVGTSGVNGFWRLDDTGSTAVSQVGSNTGTYFGGQRTGTGLIAGETNAARNLDGTDDYVDLAPGPFGAPARVSAEAWVRTDTVKPAGGYHFLVSNAATAFDDGLTLAIDSQNRAVFAVAGRTGVVGTTIARAAATSTVTLSPNTVNHVVGTYDGSQVRVYVNGVQRGAASFTPGITYSGTRDLWLGRQRAPTSQAIRALDGVLDEVAVYTVALPAATVQAHFNAGRP